MSHCPLPHQSAHMGGATNECSWWFIHANAEGKTNIFLFCHCLKKKNPYALWYILSLHYLNLFYAVQCICSFMSDVLMYRQILCCWILPRKKVHDLLARKVLARVLMVSSFGQIVHSFSSRSSHAFTISGALLSVFFLCCFCFVLLILWHLSRQQSLPTMCCHRSGHASYYCCF